MMTAPYVRCDQILSGWWRDTIHGEPPIEYDTGFGKQFPLRPGNVTILGGSPGMGKTALVMQLIFEALLRDSKLKACVLNVEMPPQRLLERQLARLSEVPLNLIHKRDFGGDRSDDLSAAFERMGDLQERLVFVQSPMSLTNVESASNSINSDIVVLDYIQRISPGGEYGDKRSSVAATMNAIRAYAAAGACVIALSAVGRSKDAKGRSSYSAEALSLASFRESSELEYGADDAYLMVRTEGKGDDDEDPVIDVTLRHLKSRYGRPFDVELSFDRSIQRFERLDSQGRSFSAASANVLEDMWEARNAS